MQAKSKRFFCWKQTFTQFEEKIAIEMNHMSQIHQTFSLASTLQGPSGQDNKESLSQFQ